MNITFVIDDVTAEYFAKHGQDVSRVAKEFALIELYRQGGIAHGEVGRELGFTQIDVHQLFILHRVREGGPTKEELDEGVERSMRWCAANPNPE